jgi:hypothetical protein
MYAVFFTNQGPAIQNVDAKGKSVNSKFCRGYVLKKVEQITVLPRHCPLWLLPVPETQSTSLVENTKHKRSWFSCLPVSKWYT